MNKLIDEKQVAALLQLSPKCLQGWRYRGGGPQFLKLGRLVRYTMSDVEAFVLEAQRTSTSDRGRPPILLSQCKNHLKAEHEQRVRALERTQAAVIYPAHETRQRPSPAYTAPTRRPAHPDPTRTIRINPTTWRK